MTTTTTALAKATLHWLLRGASLSYLLYSTVEMVRQRQRRATGGEAESKEETKRRRDDVALIAMFTLQVCALGSAAVFVVALVANVCLAMAVLEGDWLDVSRARGRMLDGGIGEKVKGEPKGQVDVEDDPESTQSARDVLAKASMQEEGELEVNSESVERARRAVAEEIEDEEEALAEQPLSIASVLDAARREEIRFGKQPVRGEISLVERAAAATSLGKRFQPPRQQSTADGSVLAQRDAALQTLDSTPGIPEGPLLLHGPRFRGSHQVHRRKIHGYLKPSSIPGTPFTVVKDFTVLTRSLFHTEGPSSQEAKATCFTCNQTFWEADLVEHFPCDHIFHAACADKIHRDISGFGCPKCKQQFEWVAMSRGCHIESEPVRREHEEQQVRDLADATEEMNRLKRTLSKVEARYNKDVCKLQDEIEQLCSVVQEPKDEAGDDDSAAPSERQARKDRAVGKDLPRGQARVRFAPSPDREASDNTAVPSRKRKGRGWTKILQKFRAEA